MASDEIAQLKAQLASVQQPGLTDMQKGLIGVVVLVVLYYLYKNYSVKSPIVTDKPDDPPVDPSVSAPIPDPLAPTDTGVPPSVDPPKPDPTDPTDGGTKPPTGGPTVIKPPVVTTTDPVDGICQLIPTCEKNSKVDMNNWEVTCQDTPMNVLTKEANNMWKWKNSYLGRTKDEFPAVRDALIDMCLQTTDQKLCNLDNNCVSTRNAHKGNYGDYQKDIKCIGDSGYTNTLLGNPGRYLFYKGYNSTTFGKYSTPNAAIKAYCNSQPRRV